ncbi:helix-turn-helix domain-containing protein [Streptomyces anthocyanicus]|uniref:helix-turn-helix domain-containing protein n=1 Tax=Streptomyces anthocyanicus TaxID=68174 RepID=UPI00363AAC2F
MPTLAAPARPVGPASPLVPVDEAATLLGCSPRTVQRRAADGTLPAHRIGARTWGIDRASLDTYRHGGTAA